MPNTYRPLYLCPGCNTTNYIPGTPTVECPRCHTVCTSKALTPLRNPVAEQAAAGDWWEELGSDDRATILAQLPKGFMAYGEDKRVNEPYHHLKFGTRIAILKHYKKEVL